MSNNNSSSVSQQVLLAFRVCVLSITLFLFSYFYSNRSILQEDELKIGFLVIGFMFAFSMISGFYVARHNNSVTNKLCLVVDSIVVSGLIYLSGLYFSQLITLYVLIVGISTVMFGVRFGFFQACLNLLIYESLLRLTYSSTIPRYGELAEEFPSMHDLAQQMITLGISSVFMIICSTIIAKRVLSIVDELKARNFLLERLELDNDIILDQLPIAIVICDDQDRVLKTSKNIELILGISLDSTKNLFQQLNCGPNKEELIVKSKDVIKTLRVSSRTIELANEPYAKTIYSFEDISKLRQIQEKLDQKSKLISLGADRNGASNSYNIIGESEKVQGILKLVDKYGKTNSNILILGESGTGKELIAKAIHKSSDRHSKPFIAVNCSAIPESLIESALFGHQKGSFTGAVGDQSGYFSQANGGTLFLDEIGELPINMQPKLLRALQEKKIRRIGAKADEDVDVRIVAATNRDLKQEVNKGNFREDLFYRLNVLAIKLPALRERKDDLEPLISHFSGQITKRTIRITEEALSVLKNYNFPGNIRELENIIERAIVLCQNEIGVEHLPTEILNGNINESNNLNTVENNSISFPLDLDSLVAEMERNYVHEAMNRAGGVRKTAADLLGISLRSLRYRLEKLGNGEWWFDS